MYVVIKLACRYMRNPPPITPAGRTDYYRKLVRSSFMKQSHDEGYSHCFEGLFLKKDLEAMGIDACVYMKKEVDERTGNTVPMPIRKCLNKWESMEIRHVTPRYLRCIKGMDVPVSPQR